MEFLLSILMLCSAVSASADTFLLKDGAKLEGEVTGEMDGAVLVKTKYGTLTIKKTDIQAQQAAPETPPQISSQAAKIEISSAAAVELSSATAAVGITSATAVAAAAPQPEPAAPPAPGLSFHTISPSTMTRQLAYFDNGVAIATETFDAAGALTTHEGAIKDGTYTEYYPDGGLKAVKNMMGGKASGTFKAFYPNGKVQIEAYYLAGTKDGAFKYFADNGKLLMEASYRNDRLDGWKKEFDDSGAARSSAYYTDDHLAEPPKAQASTEPAKELESMVTAKVVALARGERFTFELNNKYIGRANLDKDFNILSLDGKVPDGAVKIYTKEGKLQEELVFEKSTLKALRVYEPGGPLKAEYTYAENKAVKK